MVRVCLSCFRKYGEKEPFEDRTETHGYCDECFSRILSKRARRVSSLSEGKKEYSGEVDSLC